MWLRFIDSLGRCRLGRSLLRGTLPPCGCDFRPQAGSAADADLVEAVEPELLPPTEPGSDQAPEESDWDRDDGRVAEREWSRSLGRPDHRREDDQDDRGDEPERNADYHSG